MITKREKQVLTEMVRREIGGCQACSHVKRDTSTPLEPHRLRRGSAGGKYTPNNIMMVCNTCHKGFHCKEEGHGTR